MAFDVTIARWIWWKEFNSKLDEINLEMEILVPNEGNLDLIHSDPKMVDRGYRKNQMFCSGTK